MHVEEVEVAHLGNEEGDAILTVDGQANGEISGRILRNRYLGRCKLEGCSLGGVASDFHDVDLLLRRLWGYDE